MFEEIVNNKDFEKSDTGKETYDNIEELKFPQEYENISIIILGVLNEKENNTDQIQAMFKRGQHKNFFNIHNQPRLLRTTKTNYSS